MTANPDGSVTVEAVCETDSRGPQQDTDIAVLFNDGDQRDASDARKAPTPPTPTTRTPSPSPAFDPATSYIVTTRTTSPSGSKTVTPSR